MTPPRRIAALALAAALLPGAGTVAVIAPSAAAPAAERVSAAADVKYQELKTKKGHRITVTLPTAVDGGYGWVITQGRRSGKIVVLSRKVVSPEFDGAVGRPAKTVYVLRAVERGTVTVKFVQRREFDKTDVVGRFTLRLRIR